MSDYQCESCGEFVELRELDHDAEKTICQECSGAKHREYVRYLLRWQEQKEKSEK